MIREVVMAVTVCLGGAHGLCAQTAADTAGIRAAALDYIEGWYSADGARMERALHPELAKRSVTTDPRNGRSRLIQMTAMSLVQGTRAGGGSGIPTAQQRKDVRILDIYERAASVRVTAATWVDYMQLAKWNGKWQIVNVLWEDEPQTRTSSSTESAAELAGLWKAKRRFGPDARGSLIIERTGSTYTAEMMGTTVPVTGTADELSFELPNRAGRFRGKPQPGGAIRGFWFPGTMNAATPVTLLPKGANRWLGEVVPPEDEQTFFLLLSKRPDGTLAALLRNLERDYGATLGVRGLVRTGNRIGLVSRLGAPPGDSIGIHGSYDSTRQVITLNFTSRGGTYDFRRDDDDHSAFYPRGKRPARYTYRVPPALDDGWPTASIDDAGIDRAAVERLVQHVVDMSMDSINAPQIHGLLIARGGKLVLEEYFHGEHRERPHNVRSASKSVTATIAGAAMLAGAPLQLSSPVYQVMNGGAFPPDLEPRKRAMTLEHLLTMSSGYFCDDNNEAAPGREDTMWEQSEEPDFYKFTLKLPMAMAPGEQAIYCSTNPNLALGMVGRAMRESPFYLFDRLVAAPMGITHYVWGMDRAGNPYGGGGMGILPRDFIKFGQLMLNAGTWGEKRILSADFVARASTPLMKINNQREYGLLWWPQEYPYMGRTVRAFSALGAGGNLVMVFPELDLVVATHGGSYASRGWRYIGGELLTNYILPGIRR